MDGETLRIYAFLDPIVLVLIVVFVLSIILFVNRKKIIAKQRHDTQVVPYNGEL